MEAAVARPATATISRLETVNTKAAAGSLCYLTEADYPLGQRLVEQLKGTVCERILRQFPDGESYVRVVAPCRDHPATIIAAFDQPDSRTLPLLFLARALRDEGAQSVGLVAPYLPYMRQDIRFQPGEGLTSRYFADVISEHFDWLLTVDPHLHRYQSLSEVYSIPATVVPAAPAVADWVRTNVRSPLLIGPDSESIQWVQPIAERLGAPWRVLEKTRYGDVDVSIDTDGLDGRPDGTPVLVDDIISSGETMAETIRQLRGAGYPPPVCIATHALFADGATERLQEAGAAQVVSTNTVPHASNAIDVAALLARALRQR